MTGAPCGCYPEGNDGDCPAPGCTTSPKMDDSGLTVEQQELLDEMRWYGKNLACGGEREDGKSWHEAFNDELDALVAALRQDSSGGVVYERIPSLDKRIKNGDDFAGDAYVRWVAVGHHPNDGESVHIDYTIQQLAAAPQESRSEVLEVQAETLAQLLDCPLYDKPTPSALPDEAGEVVVAAKNVDWQQVVLNGGPPCFHQESGRFCGRALWWDGHDEIHKFVSLADLIERLAPRWNGTERRKKQ